MTKTELLWKYLGYVLIGIGLGYIFIGATGCVELEPPVVWAPKCAWLTPGDHLLHATKLEGDSCVDQVNFVARFDQYGAEQPSGEFDCPTTTEADESTCSAKTHTACHDGFTLDYDVTVVNGHLQGTIKVASYVGTCTYQVDYIPIPRSDAAL